MANNSIGFDVNLLEKAHSSKFSESYRYNGINLCDGGILFEDKHDWVNLNKDDLIGDWKFSLNCKIHKLTRPEYFDGNMGNVRDFEGEVFERLNTIKTTLLGSKTACLGILHHADCADVYYDEFDGKSVIFKVELHYDEFLTFSIEQKDGKISILVDDKLVFEDTIECLLPLYKFGTGFCGVVHYAEISSNHAITDIIQEKNDYYLSRANRLLLKHGIPIHTWVPNDTSDRYPTNEHLEASGMNGVTYVNSGHAYNTSMHTNNPNLKWSIALAPNGNSMWGNPIVDCTQEAIDGFMSDEQKSNRDNLVAICFGDEEYYSDERVDIYKRWFDYSKKNFPNVLVHNNIYRNEYTEHQLRHYIKKAAPDMLTYDHYHYCETTSDNEFANIVDVTNDVRRIAIEGHNGTGKRPIAFGQYLQAFKTGVRGAETGTYVMNDSQIHLVPFITLCMGGKWLNIFRWEYGSECLTLFDINRNPTETFYSYADVLKRIEKLTPYLLICNTTNIYQIVGTCVDKGTIIQNRKCKTVEEFTATSNNYIASITAESSKSLESDILVGEFQIYADIDEKDLPSTIEKTDEFIMIVNANAKSTIVQDKQNIVIRFKDALTSKQIQYIDDKTGELHDLALDENLLAKITLEGGCGILMVVKN